MAYSGCSAFGPGVFSPAATRFYPHACLPWHLLHSITWFGFPPAPMASALWAHDGRHFCIPPGHGDTEPALYAASLQRPCSTGLRFRIISAPEDLSQQVAYIASDALRKKGVSHRFTPFTKPESYRLRPPKGRVREPRSICRLMFHKHLQSAC